MATGFPYIISDQEHEPLPKLGSYSVSQSSFWKHLRECLVPDMFGYWTKLLVLFAFIFTFTHSSQWNRWWKKKKEGGYSGEQILLSWSNSRPLCLSLCRTTEVYCTGLESPCFAVRYLSSVDPECRSQVGIWPHCTSSNNTHTIQLVWNPTSLNIGCSHYHNIGQTYLQISFGLFSCKPHNGPAQYGP